MYIQGSSGGGESARTPIEQPDTLQSRTVVRLLALISEGETAGLADQANPLKSVFFNNTPVMNNDGSMNFTPVTVSEKYGLASQTVIPGFSSVEAIQAGSAIQVTTGTAVVKTAGASVDALRVPIRITALFEQASNGDTNGTSVQFRIRRRLGAGAYTTIRDETVTGKATQPFERDYLIQRPSGTGTWDIRVERITADNASLTKANDTFVLPPTEIQNVQETYANSAYLALTTNAEAVGSNLPTVTFDYIGMKIKVPSNYTVATRTYSGVWNGLFKTLPEVCDNPAWVLYDLLTNSRYGLGEYIAASDVNVYDFYAAAQYNDALVPNGAGGTEPRFRFNYNFTTQNDAWKMVQDVAAAFRAVVYTSGGLVKLVQDRPTGYSRLITNSNVSDAGFEYTSSRERSRVTSAIVYWNDPANNWVATPEVYEDDTAIARYGFNQSQFTALGCTNRGQARRYARWLVETSVSNTDVVSFSVSYNHAALEPGEIIQIADSDYAEVELEAKLVSKTSSSVTLDRPLLVAPGYTLDILGSDGITIQTRTVTSTGNLSTINFSGGAITGIAGADVVLTGSVAPRPFRVTNVTYREQNEYIVSAVQYDPNKFGRVDGTFTFPPLVYTAPPTFKTVPPVTNIVFSEESYTTAENAVRRFLNVRWTPPVGQFISTYKLFWYRDAGNINELGNTDQPFVRIPADIDGTYTVTVYAFNDRGVKSPAATASSTVDITSPAGSAALSPVTTLQVKGGGSTFAGDTCTMTWVDPNTNGASVRQGYEVKIKDSVTPTTVYRTELTYDKSFVYDLIKQAADNPAGPKRSFIVSVRVKDTFGRYSTATELTVSNPTPAAPAVSTDSGFGVYFVKIDEAGAEEKDIVGVKVWMSTTSGFTPNDATNLVYDGPDRVYSATGTAGATYYVKAAFYDSFGKVTSTLNVSAQVSAAPITFTPADPNEYKFTGLLLKANDPSANRVSWTAGTALKTSGSGTGTTWAISAGNALWSSGTRYVYYEEGDTTLSTTTTLATATGANKVIIGTYKGGLELSQGNGDFFIDGGNIYAQTIGATQLVVGSAVITETAQLANAIISGAKIQTATITNGNIFNATITGAKIADATISNAKITSLDAAKINTGILDADRIAANSLDATKIDTRNLTIKDAAGVVIFSAGVDLDNSRITPAAGWLNSNISISSGNLNGIGTGSGTKVANSSIALTVNANGSITPTGGPTSTGSVTPAGIGSVDTDLSNAPTAILNSNVGLTNSAGTISLVNAGTGSFVALTTTNKVQASNIASFFTTGSVTGTYIADATIGTAKIQLAAITTALVADAAIANAKIGDLAVSSAKIQNLAVTSAKIGDLAVSTLKIADRAVTVPVGANGSSQTLVANAADVTLCQATVNLTDVGAGGGISVIAATGGSIRVTASQSSGTSGTLTITLYRNSTLIKTQVYSVSASGNIGDGKAFRGATDSESGSVTFVHFDDVGDGTYTYSMRARATKNASSGAWSATCSAPSMVLIGSKK